MQLYPRILFQLKPLAEKPTCEEKDVRVYGK